MTNGNGPLLRSLRPFRLIAGLLAHWYQTWSVAAILPSGGKIGAAAWLPHQTAGTPAPYTASIRIAA
jgi:hypothetical protein